MSTLEPPARISKPGGAALWLARMQMKHGRKLVIALPYIWLILLFLLPFLIVFKISLAEMARAIPPYTDLLEWADGQLSITLNLGNFLQLTDDPLYFEALSAIVTNCRYFHNLLPAVGLPAGVGGGAQQALPRAISCCCW
ncbi:putrescine transporter permease PotH [Salmonella enterica subsp. enterica]|nr:putrescine transporter permease PotH [Salmonella enterica subsp. enterica]